MLASHGLLLLPTWWFLLYELPNYIELWNTRFASIDVAHSVVDYVHGWANGNQTLHAWNQFPGTDVFMSHWYQQLFALHTTPYVGVVMSVAYMLYVSIFLWPLANFFFYGPRWSLFSLGWQGLSPQDICQETTKVPSGHWILTRSNYRQCLSLIENQFHSFIVMIESFCYFLLVFGIMIWCFNRIQTCLKPQRFCKHKEQPS